MKSNFYIKTFIFSVGLLLTTTLPAFANWDKNGNWINEPWLIERTGTLIPLNTPKNIKGLNYYCPSSSTTRPQYGFLPLVKQVFREVTEVLRRPQSFSNSKIRSSACKGINDYATWYVKSFVMDVKPITRGVQLSMDAKGLTWGDISVRVPHSQFDQWLLSGYVKQTVQTNGLNGLCTKSFYLEQNVKSIINGETYTLDPEITQGTLPNKPCTHKPTEQDYNLLWGESGENSSLNYSLPVHQSGTYKPCGTNLIHEQFLPTKGPGYILKANTDPEHQYGISTTINAVRQITASWTKTYPTRPIRMGDLSLKCGIDTKDHKEHQNGKQWDIGLFWKDGRNAGGLTYKLDTYDRVLTQALINRLIAHPRITRVIFNDPLITGNSKLTRDLPGKPPEHHDHIHVDFK
jgi:hypothetical protein